MLVMSQQLPGEAESTREHQSTRAGTTEGHRSLLHRAQSHALCTLLTRMGPRSRECPQSTDCPACTMQCSSAGCCCHVPVPRVGQLRLEAADSRDSASAGAVSSHLAVGERACVVSQFWQQAGQAQRCGIARVAAGRDERA